MSTVEVKLSFIHLHWHITLHSSIRCAGGSVLALEMFSPSASAALPALEVNPSPTLSSSSAAAAAAAAAAAEEESDDILKKMRLIFGYTCAKSV